MKRFCTIVFLIVFLGCKAQTPIFPLFLNPEYGKVAGAYYKDINNDFDDFTGTWQYKNGNTKLTITLQKRAQYYNDFSKIYSDMVFGEYRYVENGEFKVNTLSNVAVMHDEIYKYNIVGNSLNTARNFPVCNDCEPDQKRLILSFGDPTRTEVEGLYGRIVLRRVDDRGIKKIEMWLRQVGNITYTEGNPPKYYSLSVPWGTYILTKLE